MKRHLFHTIIALSCAVLLAGCKKPAPEIIWDYFNTDIKITVKNADGENLLSNRTPGNLIYNDIVLTYDGKSYELDTSQHTRADEVLQPVWKGFRIDGYYAAATLLFGEFSVDTRDYRGETFTINWGDGTSSVIKFDLYATPNGKDADGKEIEPTVHQAIWLDGKLQSDKILVVNIVK